MDEGPQRKWRGGEQRLRKIFSPFSSWSHIQIKVCLWSGKALPAFTDQSKMRAIKAPSSQPCDRTKTRKPWWFTDSVFIIAFNNVGRNWTMYWLCCFRALWSKHCRAKMQLEVQRAVRNQKHSSSWKRRNALSKFSSTADVSAWMWHRRKIRWQNNIRRWKIRILQ